LILSVLGLLAGTAASLLGASELARRMRTGQPGTDLVLFLLLRLLLVSVAVLLAGLCGGLTPGGMGVAGVLALVVLLAAGAHRRLPSISRPACGRLLLAAAGVVLLRLAAQVWFLSPYDFDALSYHLTKIGEWIRAGGFTREMGVDTHASFPAGFELIETWWVVFLRHDALIEMAGLEFLLLAAASAHLLARRLGLSERAAFFAALLYVLTPGLHIQATSCLNDAPVASLVVAAFALVASRAPLPALLLVAGLAAGVKATSLYAAPGVAAWWLLHRKDAPLRPASPQLAAALGLLALAVGGFWYARNAVWYGNPIHPVGTAGLIAATGEKKIQFGPSLESARNNLSDLLNERLYDRASPITPLLIDISGWGGVVFACGLPALVLLCRGHEGFRRLALCFVLSLLSVVVLVNHDPWMLRFVLFFPLLPCLAVAELAERHRETLAVALPALALQFLLTSLPAERRVQDYERLFALSWRERSVARCIDAWPPTDAVAYVVDEPVHNRGESYLLYKPDFSCRVTYPNAATFRELVDRMKAQQVRVLYVSRTSRAHPALIEEGLRLKRLRRVGPRFYELQEAAGAGD